MKFDLSSYFSKLKSIIEKYYLVDDKKLETPFSIYYEISLITHNSRFNTATKYINKDTHIFTMKFILTKSLSIRYENMPDISILL